MKLEDGYVNVEKQTKHICHALFDGKKVVTLTCKTKACNKIPAFRLRNEETAQYLCAGCAKAKIETAMNQFKLNQPTDDEKLQKEHIRRTLFDKEKVKKKW